MTVDDVPARDESLRRRTIAVISHPDAGKSTLTEAMLLHARAISEAGAVHGKRGRASTVSDWMEIERRRGISISSAAIQFPFGDTVINLVDTPGHSDFSEDTYRVLSAVDAAIMLIDAAKGLEPQTMRLFEVCRLRGIPIITMINKWDRPGRTALSLLDEIRDRTELLPTPLTWPVGEAGYFRGLLDVGKKRMQRFARTSGGATVADWDDIDADEALASEGELWQTAVDEVELLQADGYEHDTDTFLAGISTPVFFGAAVHNVGVHHALEAVSTLAPAALPRETTDGTPRAIDAPFSAYVFKVQTGLDAAHRDRIAFMRVCSGRFERGMTVTHERTGRPFATKYAHQLFGRDRETVDEAWPGDVVGLVNATMLRPGDTLYDAEPVRFPEMPRFIPEHFRVVRSADMSKHKQFRKGLASLDEEGVVQLMRSERRGDGEPIAGAVGPLQFEVFAARMESEFSAPIRLDALPYETVCDIDDADADVLGRERECEVVTRSDGRMLMLVSNSYRLRVVQRLHPDRRITILGGADAA
jgi:peptide chain release factor 3